jgi:hypothetical protein
MRENALMHGPQMERSASDPVGERRAIKANTPWRSSICAWP